MSKPTTTERLAVVEEQIREMKKTITEGFDDTKVFQADLIARLDVLLKTFNDEKTTTAKEIATLKEQTKTISKIVWLSLSAAITGFIATLYQLISGKL